MRQFIYKIGFYSIIYFTFFNAISFVSLYFLKKSNFYKPEFLKNVKEKKFDYLVLGSSTGLTTLDTKYIDSITNKKGLNISLDDSALNSHFLMLEHYLALKKETKCLVLAVTPWDLADKNPKLNNNDYRFLPFISDNYVYEYFKNMETNSFKPLSFSKYFPIIGVSYYNTELFYPSIIAAIKPEKRNHFDDKGNFSYPIAGEPDEKEFENISLIINNPFFKKIEDICKKNNIKLITYFSPMYKTTIISNQNNFVNHSNLIQDKTMFYDNIHVNRLGRKKCSDAFAEILNKNL
jgi:hypothetical protein